MTFSESSRGPVNKREFDNVKLGKKISIFSYLETVKSMLSN